MLSSGSDPGPDRIRHARIWAECSRDPATGHLGRISYGLYGFHVPVLAGWPQHGCELPWFARLPATFGLTVAIPALSYRLLEQPFLRLKERFRYVRSSPGELGGT